MRSVSVRSVTIDNNHQGEIYVGQFLASFAEYPPRQEAASFSLDKLMEKLSQPGGTQ